MTQLARRGQGQKDPTGSTKRKILFIIFNRPDGISEPDIRDLLQQKENIRSGRGIKKHFEHLFKNKYIQKESRPGFGNIWKPPADFESFKSLISDKLVWTDITNEELSEFNSTQYVQQIIIPSLVDELIEKPPYLNEFNEFYHLNLHEAEISENELNEIKNYYTQALKISPSLLRHFFQPNVTILMGLHATQYISLALTDNLIFNQLYKELNPSSSQEDREKLIDELKENLRFYSYNFKTIEEFGVLTAYISVLNDMFLYPDHDSQFENFFTNPTNASIWGIFVGNPIPFFEIGKYFFTSLKSIELIKKYE